MILSIASMRRMWEIEIENEWHFSMNLQLSTGYIYLIILFKFLLKQLLFLQFKVILQSKFFMHFLLGRLFLI